MTPVCLIVSPVPTHPTRSGNTQRILQLCREIEEQGYSVHMAYIKFDSGDIPAMQEHWGDRLTIIPYNKPFKKIRVCGIKIPDRISKHLLHRGWICYPLDFHFDDTALIELEKLQASLKPTVVMVEYVFFSKAFDAFPRVRKLLDTHDVFASRHKRLMQAGLSPEWFFTTKDEEGQGLLRADAILAIQQHETNILSQTVQEQRPVLTVGHLAKPESLPPPQALKRLVFLGSENSINKQAVQWFVRQVWPLVNKMAPDVEFHVYGSIGAFCPTARNVVIHGRVDSLKSIFESADAILNPAQTGTGLAIKSLEALAFGLPLISTTAGAKGLPKILDKEAYITADSPENMAMSIKQLYENPISLTKLSEAASSYYQLYYQENKAQLKLALEGSI